MEYTKVFQAGFNDRLFEIECNDNNGYNLAQFLFSDFPGTQSRSFLKRYRILSLGAAPMLSLWDGEKLLYHGESPYQLAYILMNEVIFHCIDKNERQHAIHAGAVADDNCCIILPGKSGSGKSTLTTWLVKNGFSYLSDELVFLEKDGSMMPLTRPINLKVDREHESWLLPEDFGGRIISCAKGSMIPHRLVNNRFSLEQRKVTHIIFPKFIKGAAVEFGQISPAKSCLFLVQSYVNARNLNNMGMSDLSSIVRQCRSYTLTYGSFDDLENIFLRPSAGPDFLECHDKISAS
ncbi:hypothetical protein [Desulforhopalus singaporensis]|uniref:HprK-related kinase A n=1 Tax=Desulforhopalus singaporensis TaxID=91360 RepID=A0A1H0SFR0_9BACT|nr:hypothetical protein [Desulforhopalus singaporensis]SDP40349.1 hypothetical protein SAMN05660330_02671 [Desulforhopalus singaporensis]